MESATPVKAPTVKLTKGTVSIALADGTTKDVDARLTKDGRLAVHRGIGYKVTTWTVTDTKTGRSVMVGLYSLKAATRFVGILYSAEWADRRAAMTTVEWGAPEAREIGNAFRDLRDRCNSDWLWL